MSRLGFAAISAALITFGAAAQEDELGNVSARGLTSSFHCDLRFVSCAPHDPNLADFWRTGFGEGNCQAQLDGGYTLAIVEHDGETYVRFETPGVESALVRAQNLRDLRWSAGERRYVLVSQQGYGAHYYDGPVAMTIIDTAAPGATEMFAGDACEEGAVEIGEFLDGYVAPDDGQYVDNSGGDVTPCCSFDEP